MSYDNLSSVSQNVMKFYQQLTVEERRKRGGSLSFLVGTISNVLVMEIGWTDVGGGGISFNTSSVIFQLYHGENKLIFNEMMMRSALF